jgi:hypothetical protein
VKGKLANGVGSQYSHTMSQRGVSSITNTDVHTSAASSRLNWLPRRFKWTRPFRQKTKCGFCACAIRFCTSSTTSVCFWKSTEPLIISWKPALFLLLTCFVMCLSDFCISSWPWTCLAWKNRRCELKRCCHLPLLYCPGGNSTTLHSYKNCVHTNTKELCVKCKNVTFTK